MNESLNIFYSDSNIKNFQANSTPSTTQNWHYHLMAFGAKFEYLFRTTLIGMEHKNLFTLRARNVAFIWINATMK